MSQLVVGLVVMGGNLVINLLPFTSGRINSEETKRKRRRRRKPRVSVHLGKLRGRAKPFIPSAKLYLTVGEQGGKGLVGGQLGVVWAPAFPEHLQWACLHTLLHLVLTATLSSGLISPASQKKCCSFIRSIFIEPLWGDSGGHDRACPPAAYLAQMESIPRSLASMHTYSSRTKI